MCQALKIPTTVIQAPSKSGAATAAAAKLPRGRKVPALVPEFARISVVQLDTLPPVDTKRCLTASIGDIPRGSKFLSHVLLEKGDAGGHGIRFECSFGIYRSKADFLGKALQLVHPFDDMCPLKDDCIRMVFTLVTKGPLWVVNKRIEVLKRWTAKAKSLLPDDRRLKDHLEAGVSSVLATKRILLLQFLADQVGWPDTEIVTLMQAGFDLVGNAAPSGVFDVELKPAEITVDKLLDDRKFMKPALLGKVKSTVVDDDHRELWAKTCQEADGHLLEGPLTVGQVDSMFPGGWSPVRRFGVRQSSGETTKLRPIDDYSECKVNQAFGYCDKIDLRAMDELVWILRAWTFWLLEGEACVVRLSDGSLLQAPVHPSWKSCDIDPLLSTIDLHAAYKQFAISPGSRALSVVVLKQPGCDSVGCFVGKALPFGSTASVVFFNRIARLLWRLGLELYIPWCNYFDDYPVFAPACIAGSTMTTALALLDLLGFSYASEKLVQFDRQATMLGVEVSCAEWKDKKIVVRNKESRSRELLAYVKNLQVGDRLSPKEFLGVIGRFQFAEAQVMGRIGKLALGNVRSWMHHREVLVDEQLQAELVMLGERVRHERPRLVPPLTKQQPILVFTDGASEDALHVVGGLIFFPGDVPPRFFGGKVPKGLTDEWFVDLKHIIGPVEAYAVLVARALWHKHLVGTRCIYFIDNYGAMDAFIKGSSHSVYFRKMLLAFERLEANGYHWPWFTRVPSFSNIADDPTRLGLVESFPDMTRDDCFCPLLGCRLENFEG